MVHVLSAILKDLEVKPLSRASQSKITWNPYPQNNPNKKAHLTQDYLWPVSPREMRHPRRAKDPERPADPREILPPRRLYNRRNRHLSLRPVRLQASPRRNNVQPNRLRQHRLRHRSRSGSLQSPTRGREDGEPQAPEQMHPRNRRRKPPPNRPSIRRLPQTGSQPNCVRAEQ